jgi:hypothetical protein
MVRYSMGVSSGSERKIRDVDWTKPWAVWRSTQRGGQQGVKTFRWRWLARLYAWEHTKRGWFIYEVKPSSEWTIREQKFDPEQSAARIDLH